MKWVLPMVLGVKRAVIGLCLTNQGLSGDVPRPLSQLYSETAAATSQDSGHSALAPSVSPGDTSFGIPRFLASLASSTNLRFAPSVRHVQKGWDSPAGPREASYRPENLLEA